MRAAEARMAGYIAGWRPSSVSPQAAEFARAVHDPFHDGHGPSITLSDWAP